MSNSQYDAVVIGAGIIGALVAKELTAAGKRVLILEAGRAMGLKDEDPRSYEVYKTYTEHYQQALIKIPNSPYPPNPNAASNYATDNVKIEPGTPDLNGAMVQTGPYPFMSSYLRQQGGTTLHWMGSCPRMMPDDFTMQSRYKVAVDWPLDYDTLMPEYARAEWEIGVAANVEEQAFMGIKFAPDYDYPMEALPLSYSDQFLSDHIQGHEVQVGKYTFKPELSALPVARNAIPRPFAPQMKAKGFPWDNEELVHEVEGQLYYRPRGAVGAPNIGMRCEGNSSCTPICPVQAKYSALKTLAQLDPKLCEIRTQCVVSTLEHDENGRISKVNYLRYADEGMPGTPESVTAQIYVLAAHAIENAKILLASNVANRSDQVGRNLMDHPYFMTWALAPKNVGAFRGPGYTGGIPTFRNGEFRREWAAFRLDLGNWGWNFSAFAPGSDVQNALAANVIGRKLRAQLADQVPRQMRLGFQIEQLPAPGNRVSISDEYRDLMGLHRPIVAYDIADYTWEAMRSAIKVSDSIWDCLGVAPDQRFHSGGGEMDAGLPTYHVYKGTPLAFYGAGHIAGTHRMGSSPTDSVVNDYQRCWDHENLYAVGCGSMPTIATANPTLTAAALTLRSARDMLKQLGPSSSGAR